ncbi:MAG: VOC family protein [Chloroflexi bacterium]|nr:VOC family protein [Chloroflexota bacterium]
MITGLTYFSVAVRDLNEAVALYKTLGLEQATPIRETRWGFKNAMMGSGGRNYIELIQVSDPNSALARHMRSRARPDNPEGEGIYLVSLEVDDLRATMDRVRASGGRVTTEPESPNTAWVHPLSTRFALLELAQRQGR